MPVPDGLLDPLLQIHTRKAVEDNAASALSASAESPFRSIVEDLPDALVVLDPDGRILYANATWRRYRAMTLEGAVGQNIVDLADGEERQILARERRRLLRRLTPDCPLVTLEFSNIDHMQLEVTYQGWFDDAGTLLAISALARDRTRAHRHEQDLETANRALQDSNRDLRDFAHIASHDLQEPLRKISAFSERLMDRYADQLDERGVDYLMRVSAASGRMQQLIQSLLEYSRVNSRGKSFVPVELDKVVGDVLQDLEVAIDEAGATVVLERLPVVEGDPTQLHQLFLNLIGNALKFRSPDRAVEVKVSGLRVGDEWQVRVADNGIGFEPEYAEKIFAPFQRLHTRSAYEGSGIGLAVCRRIVERHGGTIGASSAPGAGAKFVVALPCRRRAEAPRTRGASTDLR